MGTVGLWGVIIVIAIILLLYGAKRLPDMARSLGRSSREFKDALEEAPEEFRGGMREGAVEPVPSEAGVADDPSERERELERELEAERARRKAAAPTE